MKNLIRNILFIAFMALPLFASCDKKESEKEEENENTDKLSGIYVGTLQLTGDDRMENYSVVLEKVGLNIYSIKLSEFIVRDDSGDNVSFDEMIISNIIPMYNITDEDESVLFQSVVYYDEEKEFSIQLNIQINEGRLTFSLHIDRANINGMFLPPITVSFYGEKQ